MDGRPRQNPAYRPATGKPRVCGAFPCSGTGRVVVVLRQRRRALLVRRAKADTPVVAGRVFRTELNPVDFLERAAFVYPRKVALVHGARRYTYAELGERAWRLANALRDAGLDKGDRV